VEGQALGGAILLGSLHTPGRMEVIEEKGLAIDGPGEAGAEADRPASMPPEACHLVRATF
jgi:hypothetical protein